MLDILIVNYNTKHLLKSVFDATQNAHGSLSPRYLIVDNASSDGSVEEIKKLGLATEIIVNKNNIGFGRANNQLVPLVEGRYILLLNTDAFVESNSLIDSIGFMERHPSCGVLGLRLVGQNGEPQPSCRYFPTPLNTFLSRTGLFSYFLSGIQIDRNGFAPKEVTICDWVPGCFYLIRREVLQQVGLFDSRFFLYYEEVDHCKRVKSAGWNVMYSPHSAVVHLGGESAKSDGELSVSGRQLSALQIESELLYFRKHHGRSGVALHLSLVVLGDILICFKDVLRKRSFTAALNRFQNTRLVYLLWWRTRFASVPTR